MYSFVLNLNMDVSPWHIGYSKDSHLLTREEGGTKFYELLQGSSGGYTAGPNYMINPDFTWKQTDYPEVGDVLFTDKGIYPHDCATDIKTTAINKNKRSSILGLKDNQIHINAAADNEFVIKLLTAKGQTICVISNQHLNFGYNRINLGPLQLSKGVYFGELSSGDDVSRKQLIIK